MMVCECGNGCKCGSDCKCKGYCRKCKGMIWSLIGVLLLFNAFVWPKWLGTDGWMAFFGIILMFVGVWKAYINGCSCRKDDAGSEPEEKPVNTGVHKEEPAVEPVNTVPAQKPRKRKK